MMDFLACRGRSDVMIYARVVTLLHAAGTERSQALPSVGKAGIALRVVMFPTMLNEIGPLGQLFLLFVCLF